MSEYTLAPSTITKAEICLRVAVLNADATESRGSLLARALRGRYARELRCFYLTPARAAKWRALFVAGFSARQIRLGSDYVWRFSRDRHEWLSLHNATQRATPVLEVS